MRHYVVNLYERSQLVYARGGPARDRKHAIRLTMKAAGTYAPKVTRALVDLDGNPTTRREYAVQGRA